MQEFFEDGFVKKSVLEKGVFVLKAAVRLYRQTTEGLVADFMKNYATTYGEEQEPFEVLLPAFVALTFTLSYFCFMSCNKGTTTIGDESCGQVALDVSATSHPGSGEREGHIRGWLDRGLTQISGIQNYDMMRCTSLMQSLQLRISSPSRMSVRNLHTRQARVVCVISKFCAMQVTVAPLVFKISSPHPLTSLAGVS